LNDFPQGQVIFRERLGRTYWTYWIPYELFPGMRLASNGPIPSDVVKRGEPAIRRYAEERIRADIGTLRAILDRPEKSCRETN
jgi:hypothetical protein